MEEGIRGKMGEEGREGGRKRDSFVLFVSVCLYVYF